MRAFYSDTFVLPLPDHHRFPMAKYRLLRERLVDEGILAANDLQVPEAIAWDDPRLIHDAAYVDAVAAGLSSAEAQRRIGFPWSPMMVERSRRSVGATLAAACANLAGGTHHAFRNRGEGYRGANNFPFRKEVSDLDVPVVVVMSGGYAPDVDAIVTIHTNTIREAVAHSHARTSAPSHPAPSHPAPSHSAHSHL